MTLKQKEMIKQLKQKLDDITKMIKQNKTKKMNRREFVLSRDDFKCRLCGEEKSLQVHHLTPKEIGGKDDLENLITVCLSCHHFMHCNPKIVLKSKQGHSLAIKKGLYKAQLNGRKLGRQQGAKDKKPRKKEGYYNRWLGLEKSIVSTHQSSINNEEIVSKTQS